MEKGKFKLGETAIIGIVVMIQGFGSALAKAIWDNNWGLLALAERWMAIPAWAGVLVGVVGVAVTLFGLRQDGKRHA